MALTEKMLSDKFHVRIIYFQNYKETMVSVHFVFLLVAEQEVHGRDRQEIKQ